MPIRVAHWVVVSSVALAALAVEARAEEYPSAAAHAPGDTDWALPGIARVGVADSSVKRVSAALTAGYGYTEAQRSGDGAHHRVFGSGAVAITPIAPLSIALRFDERFDIHPDDGMGSHSAAVGDPRIMARVGGAFGSFRLGGEVGAWFPGKDAPSISFGATTLDARLLGAWVSPSRLTLGAMAGFRLDKSSNAIDHPERLRFGDQLALSLSDFNAVLVGVGASVPLGALGATELLGEFSGDLLVGSGAPSIGDSPLRVTAGVRQRLSRLFALEFRAEAALSGRPTVDPAALVPIEPRVSVLAGLRFTLPFQNPDQQTQVPVTTPVVVAPPPPVVVVVAPTSATITVHVTAEDGTPIGDAKVQLKLGEWSHPAEGGADGSYKFTDVPSGDAVLSITEDGFVAVEQHVPVVPGAAAPIEVKLVRATPSGQLRGLIRSFGGKGLAALIHVDPIGKETKADAEGTFTVDVPPGDYQVVITAPHFKEQKRKIHVGENGVTILNAELFEAK